MKTREEFTESVFRKAEVAMMEEKKVKVRKKRLYRTIGTMTACLVLLVGIVGLKNPNMVQELLGREVPEETTYSLGEDSSFDENQIEPATGEKEDSKISYDYEPETFNITKMNEKSQEIERVQYYGEEKIKEVKKWLHSIESENLLNREEFKKFKKGNQVGNYLMVEQLIATGECETPKTERQVWYVIEEVEIPEF